MTVNARGLERFQIVEAFPVVNLNTGANNGDYVSLAKYKRCMCVLAASVGTVGNDATITLQQAKDVAGTSAKNLTVITTGFTKIAATDLTGTGQWTKTTQAAANTFTKTHAASDSLFVVEVTADQLDGNNGFVCLRMTVAQPGATILGYGFYILLDPRYPDAAENMLSAIVI